jgi:hypothetical protein
MESMTTYEWILKYDDIKNYKQIGQKTLHQLELPKSINNKCFNIFKQNQNQINNSYFCAKLNDINIFCSNNGINGASLKTYNSIYLNDLSSYWSESVCLDAKLTIRYILENPAIFIGQKWGGHNFFHYLHTSLPKLVIMDIYNLDLNSIKIIHNSINKNYISESFSLLGINLDNIICLDDYPNLKTKNLYICSPIGYGVNPNIESCKILKYLFTKYTKNKKELGLYIKRTSGRKIINEDEIINILITKDFKIIEPDKLNFLEQISLFSSAHTIIAPHGAGLSNLVWCPSGAKVLEMFSPTYVGLCYWLMADSCNLNYYYLIGEGYWSDDSDYWYSNGLKDMKINIDDFKRTLDLMEV